MNIDVRHLSTKEKALLYAQLDEHHAQVERMRTALQRAAQHFMEAAGALRGEDGPPWTAQHPGALNDLFSTAEFLEARAAEADALAQACWSHWKELHGIGEPEAHD